MRLIREAREGGARLASACRIVGVDSRTVQRWEAGNGDDMRMGPKTKPANSLSEAEQAEVLRIANSEEFRNLSPKQIVPMLADMGRYVASESSIERLLKKHDQKAHRGPKRRKSATKPREKLATGPCQVWTWDITYLRSPIVGQFFYYNRERPHQGLGGRFIVPPANDNATGPIECKERLGGLLRFYRRQAA